ncbi:MAG TPA: GTPase, partial [Aeromicrobium sp.]|nr:GTPase [Aeromicrobium sp.]
MAEPTGNLPVLAVIGRPNVGKSTLVNRILGRREAVVEDIPGVTRDRVSYDALWNGREFTIVDTGGWDPDARGMAERIAAQAEIAINISDA